MPTIGVTYLAMVGSLLYIANWTRPDISFAVSELSQLISNRGQVHLKSAKRVFSYLKQSVDLHLQYGPSTVPDFPTTENELWDMSILTAGCPDDRSSTVNRYPHLEQDIHMQRSKCCTWISERISTSRYLNNAHGFL